MSRDPNMQVAIVGCGAVVERFHLPAARRLADLQVCAFVDKDRARARSLSLKFACRRAKVCDDVAELPPETQAAIVAVPNAHHAPISRDLLKRGIHVLCEKPMATTVEQCREMVQAAREGSAVLMVGHHKRFVPTVRQAKEWMEQGLLGRIRTITGSMGMPWQSWRSRTRFQHDLGLAGGGVLIDSGVHLIDLVLWLFGEPELLNCHVTPEGSPIEDEAKVEFRTAAGAFGSLRFSRRRMLPNVFRVDGERGFLEFDTYDYPSLKVFSRDRRLCRNVGSVCFRWPHKLPQTSPYLYQLRHFVRFIRGEVSESQNSGEEAARTIEIVGDAYSRVRTQSALPA